MAEGFEDEAIAGEQEVGHEGQVLGYTVVPEQDALAEAEADAGGQELGYIVRAEQVEPVFVVADGQFVGYTVDAEKLGQVVTPFEGHELG